MMDLLFVRHGKAQKRGTVAVDRERKLVPRGIAQLKEDSPHLAEYLKGREKIYLWSSRMMRAMETAEIIKGICEIGQIDYRDFIETGDFCELEQSLKQMEEDSTIIIVGHEPDLSEWTHLISKKTICFKKGSAISFNILTTEKLAGEIQWIAEPGEYKRMIRCLKRKENKDGSP